MINFTRYFGKGNQLGILFIFNLLWWDTPYERYSLWKMSLALSFTFWAINQSSYTPNAIFRFWTVFVNFFFKSCQIVVRTGTSMKLISFAFQRLEVMLWLYEWTRWSFGLVKARRAEMRSMCIFASTVLMSSGWLVGNRAMPQRGTIITCIYGNTSLLTKAHSCRSGLCSEKRK